MELRYCVFGACLVDDVSNTLLAVWSVLLRLRRPFAEVWLGEEGGTIRNLITSFRDQSLARYCTTMMDYALGQRAGNHESTAK